MAEKIELIIDVKGGDSVANASEKVKSLKTQLKEMKAQLASGSLSAEEFNRISKEAGKLEDKLGDVNKRVKNLASDTKYLDGFVSVAQGIAGGFAAAQGAIALFGSENKDLQKTLIKVQGAVALLNGVQAVANVLNKESAAMTLLNTTRVNILTFAQARYNAVVGTTTGVLKALRIVGATLGIGLIVAAIALLISKFDSIKKVVMKFIPSLETLGRWFTNIFNAITDFIGVTSDATRALDKFRAAQEFSFAQQEREIELLKARGATAKEIYAAEAKLINDRKKLLQEERRVNGELTKEQREEYIELNQKMALLDAERTKSIQEENKKRAEENKKAAEEREKDRIADLHREHDRANEINKIGSDLIEKEREMRLKALQDKWALQEEEDAAAEEAIIKEQQRLDKQQENYNNYVLAIAEAENNLQQAKRGALEAGLNIAQQFTQKNKAINDVLFAVQKGVAIAQVIIDTQKEIAGYAANPTWSALPDGGATLKATAITAAKVRAATSIATIAATSIGKFMGGSGGSSVGGSSGGGFGGNTSSPQIQGYSTNTTQGNQTGGQQLMKVFVTETDIRKASNTVNDIYSQAKIE